MNFTKHCSDLSLFEQIVLVISKYLEIFSRSREQFFLIVGQNNFGNKISREDTTNFSLVNFSGGTLVRGADGSGILQKSQSHLFSSELFKNSDKNFVRILGADSLFLEQK